ncbi:MAG: aminotransferase class III-fold pyridoxal phosphate-dependent enzyme [bacterium]|nr:aminotransferase class III-fold pyridoxal phosphate-dependent enzyme [bacterium]
MTISILKKLKENSGAAKTVGLNDTTIAEYLIRDKSLKIAIEEAWDVWKDLSDGERQDLLLPEEELIKRLQSGVLNFYSSADLTKYIPLSAQGPWIVTAYGAVVYDTGGYGMIGFGHNPEFLSAALSTKHVMANIKTPSFWQRRASNILMKKIGFSGKDCPFSQFIWMNSGSEAITVAARISDANARVMTDAGGVHQGKKLMFAAAKGGFHGRADCAAQVSDSSMKNYKNYLASFRDRENLLLFEINNSESLKDVYAKAARENIYIEALFLEPVMGEGNPGQALHRDFYDLARKLSKDNNTILIVDSIQAGIRGQGCLSIVDYPGFENIEAPDMEAYSKAINAGQYPISVLALRKEIAELYKIGIYGNTMTTNPRALEVACTVLQNLNADLSNNIQIRGKEFVEKFKALQKELPELISKVQGTGLLIGVELNKDKFKVTGFGGVEEYIITKGVNVIHGGANSLRFTPHFYCTSNEIDLVVASVREALLHFQKKQDFKTNDSSLKEKSQGRASLK